MRNKLTDELAVCGMNAVLAVCEYNPQIINRLFFREDRLDIFTGICKQLAERKRPYKICEDEELERICKSVHHQGVVAMIEEPVIEPLSPEDLDFWASEGKTGVILHSVGNDHNLGAIARAAAFFDVKYFVLNEKDSLFKPLPRPEKTISRFASIFDEQRNEQNENQNNEQNKGQDKPDFPDTPNDDFPPEIKTRLTTSAYRVAEGAFEHLTIRSVRNTFSFLKDASKKLVTIGTDTRARLRIGDLGSIVKNLNAPGTTATSGSKTGAVNKALKPDARPGIALVLGNEETGLPKNVKDQCSCLLRIPGTGNIDSLNVSQAAALFLHAIYDM